MKATTPIKGSPPRSAAAAPSAPPTFERRPTARRPKRRTDLTEQALDGEGLIFDPRTADTHRLNETAYFIWGLLDGAQTTDDVAMRLAERYDVSTTAAMIHVDDLLATLAEKGLLDVARFDSGGEPSPGELRREQAARESTGC